MYFRGEMQAHNYRPNISELLPAPYTSVAVIGATGEVGYFLIRELSRYSNLSVFGAARPSQVEKTSGQVMTVERTLAMQPKAVIVATPNPAEETLSEIAEHLSPYSSTIILPQNGVAVVDAAKTAFGSRPNLPLIRMSIFTAVADGVYDRGRRRIAVAPITDTGEETAKVATLFKQLKFTVDQVEDYQAMEFTKLLLDLIGATRIITGLNADETFKDHDLFLLELQGLHDRLAVLEAEGIETVNFGWQSLFKTRTIAEIVRRIHDVPWTLVREMFARAVSADLNSYVSTAARNVEKDQAIPEVPFYHMPFIEMGEKHGLLMPVDRAVATLATKHNDGIETIGRFAFFNLRASRPEVKKRLLLEEVQQQSLDQL